MDRAYSYMFMYGGAVQLCVYSKKKWVIVYEGTNTECVNMYKELISGR